MSSRPEDHELVEALTGDGVECERQVLRGEIKDLEQEWRQHLTFCQECDDRRDRPVECEVGLALNRRIERLRKDLEQWLR